MPTSGSSRRRGRPAPVRYVVLPRGGPGLPERPGRYVPHVVIIVIVVLAAIVGPPGQVEAALFALAAILPLLGFRAESA